MEFGFSFGRPQGQPDSSSENDSPLRILILGHFSGTDDVIGATSRQPLLKRPLIRIDLDSFEAVLRRLAPTVCLRVAGDAASAEKLEFLDLDDFRPEQLGKKLTTFRQLLTLRQQLLNPATFAQAAAELRQGLLAHPPESEPSKRDVASSIVAPSEDDASLLERLLGQPAGSDPGNARKAPVRQSSFDVQQLIDQAVAPYIVPKADPRQDVYLAAVDSALGDQMRTALHDPSLQSLEATWRSLRRLISSIEDDGSIEIHLLDVAYEELLADVPTNDEELSRWSLFRRLAGESDGAPGTRPWSLIIGDFHFGARPDEIALLSAFAVLAEFINAPLIASADSSLLGCSSLVDQPNPADWQPLDDETSRIWHSLRRSSAASWVGLVLPRILLRLPYGKETDEVESFAFEEVLAGRQHEDFLWGNAAYLCAGLITQSFASDGWSFQPPSQIDIDDLPAFTFSDEGEVKLLPCAEVAFGERTADAMLQRGVMPLLSWKDRNAVRFLRFQSIAQPLAPLDGPWS